ncbi:GNAT family N-acetyltransferase [Faecalibacter bovis]|uniref:GNAT family N-acetyltransferase n=1 Tax=Faecalibacter bovis TaxID=2898187 RepID=A0ABX7XCK7_9FLAO|nr:GNAT family N-acetyltransferase [Faecalibacter bovis]QTV05630.1 GNAT family N-acetyltransferase [Faecalibacter bovis]
MYINPFEIKPIETERLTLIPYTKEIAQEILDSNFKSIEALNLTCGKNWPDQEIIETLPKIVFNLSKVIAPTGFESWMIVKKDTKEIIGDVGFKGYNTIFNKADIGYGIIEAERKKGFAIEAVKGLINWAYKNESLSLITATTLIDNKASIQLLERLHFIKIDQENDFFYWELNRQDYLTNFI